MFTLIVMKSGHSVIPILLLTESLINILWFRDAFSSYSCAYLSFEILILRVVSFYLNVILVGGGFSHIVIDHPI